MKKGSKLTNLNGRLGVNNMKLRIIRNNLRYIWRWLTSPIFRNNEYARDFQEQIDYMYDQMKDNARLSSRPMPEIVVSRETKELYKKHFPELF